MISVYSLVSLPFAILSNEGKLMSSALPKLHSAPWTSVDEPGKKDPSAACMQTDLGGTMGSLEAPLLC